jgi:hypothetical protein
MLPFVMVMTVLLSYLGMPDGRILVGSSEVKSRLQHAVLRFDTRIIFSCEEFAREMIRRPSSVNLSIRDEGRWERIKTDSLARRYSGHASPKCLVQAGLLVV